VLQKIEQRDLLQVKYNN